MSKVAASKRYETTSTPEQPASYVGVILCPTALVSFETHRRVTVFQIRQSFGSTGGIVATSRKYRTRFTQAVVTLSATSTALGLNVPQLLAAPVASPTVTPPVWARVTAPNGDNNDQVSAVRTPDGALHVVWVNRGPGATEDLHETVLSSSGRVPTRRYHRQRLVRHRQPGHCQARQRCPGGGCGGDSIDQFYGPDPQSGPLDLAKWWERLDAQPG